MVLKLIRTQMLLTKVAVTGAFTVGAVGGAIAGAAGIAGLCALRKVMKEKREASPSEA